MLDDVHKPGYRAYARQLVSERPPPGASTFEPSRESAIGTLLAADPPLLRDDVKRVAAVAVDGVGLRGRCRSASGRPPASPLPRAAGWLHRRCGRSGCSPLGARRAGSARCPQRGSAARRRCRRAPRPRSGSSSRGPSRRLQPSARLASASTRPGVSGLAFLASEGLQFATACTATGSTKSPERGPRRRRAARSRDAASRPNTSATRRRQPRSRSRAQARPREARSRSRPDRRAGAGSRPRGPTAEPVPAGAPTGPRNHPRRRRRAARPRRTARLRDRNEIGEKTKSGAMSITAATARKPPRT